MGEGFNFYGESQGGLEARSWVGLYNYPQVYNLVAISGPQEGVGLCPETAGIPIVKQVCAGGAPALDIYDWPDCSFCNYWHGEKKKNLKKSKFLAMINNAGENKDEKIRQNMMSLN